MIILNTYDQQFTLATKKSLHIIFNPSFTAGLTELITAGRRTDGDGLHTEGVNAFNT